MHILGKGLRSSSVLPHLDKLGLGSHSLCLCGAMLKWKHRGWKGGRGPRSPHHSHDGRREDAIVIDVATDAGFCGPCALVASVPLGKGSP